MYLDRVGNATGTTIVDSQAVEIESFGGVLACPSSASDLLVGWMWEIPNGRSEQGSGNAQCINENDGGSSSGTAERKPLLK